MSLGPSISGEMLLGALAGGQLVLIALSLLVAGAYRDRVLLWHAAAMAVSVSITFLQAGGRAGYVAPALLVLMALGVLQMRALTVHVGSLRPRRRLITGAALAIALLAVVDALVPWPLLAVGIAAWLAAVALLTLRAWPQSRPWVVWLVLGNLALLAAAIWHALAPAGASTGRLAGLLAFWAMAVYLASVWRSRVFGEHRSRQAVANTLNPLTGLSTPLVLMQRIEAARALMRRYGHPGALVLLHLEHLDAMAAKLGAEAAEAAALEAGTRIRDALGAGDVAARLGFQRFAVLSEGTPIEEAAAQVAARILTAGLRAPLTGFPGNYFHFRAVVTPLPKDGVVMAELMEQLGQRLTADVARRRDKRIRIVPAEEMQLTTVPGGQPGVVTTRY